MIIAFDPGVTTGIAVLEDDGSVRKTFAMQSLTAVDCLCESLKIAYPDAMIIAEAPPQHGGNHRQFTQRIEECLKRHFPDSHWVYPGNWKGTPASRTPVPNGLSQHERDAVHLGRSQIGRASGTTST